MTTVEKSTQGYTLDNALPPKRALKCGTSTSLSPWGANRAARLAVDLDRSALSDPRWRDRLNSARACE